MNWSNNVTAVLGIILAIVAVAGVAASFAILVQIVRQGGWKLAEPSVRKARWQMVRPWMLVGAAFGLLSGLALVFLNQMEETPPNSANDLIISPRLETKSRPRDDGSPVPAVAADNAIPFTEETAPDFDPKLTLVWPGTPEESRRRINAGKADETTIYGATLMQTQSVPVTIFSANVYELSESDLQGSDPKELLASHLTSGDEVELTRKEIEHGPNKHPGLDVTSKEADSFLRRVNVMVGRRIYSVQVISLMQERLAAADVLRFFESFAIKD